MNKVVGFCGKEFAVMWHPKGYIIQFRNSMPPKIVTDEFECKQIERDFMEAAA